MLDVAVVLAVFALVFVAELPDKTAVTSLVLGARFPWRWVFTGVAAAFAVHVLIAIGLGTLLTLLPHRVVDAVVAGLFLLGAVLVWREGRADPDVEVDAYSSGVRTGSWKVAGLAFGVVFLAEWGDLTQILTANLAAKYDDPIPVGIGAVLGLWSVALLAVLGGRTLLKVLPITWITRIAALAMAGLGIYSAVAAAT